MQKLKKNDKVIVISGKYKGKQGSILGIVWKKNCIRVEGVNILTKHVKPKKQGEKGGIVKEEGFIHISNVMPIRTSDNKPCRINKIER
ncbi:50S ribosomal protein L24 [bacterium]|jgi:large subunit ribosomal protein L24|nr:50S ribosomal protein L24 [bacterium]MBT5015200.1 50S ribosomal protein L24 [bacterium]